MTAESPVPSTEALVEQARTAAAWLPVASDVQDSICEMALRASDFADASDALSRWPRNVGRAIAARMPMIRMTTSSSMSVKPDSSWARERRLDSM